jgi:peptidoglycan L-alanyl-D-glutamate endopeptidase CwlK
MSRRIDHLHPELQMRALRCIQKWEAAGLSVLVTCTWRSREEQAELYAQGRTKSGRIVTRAMPGQSAHNFTVGGKPAALAFDVVPLRHGKCVWGTRGDGIDDDPTDDDVDDLELWHRVAGIAKECGLEWAGEWSRFREFPHFQLRNAAQIMSAG